MTLMLKSRHTMLFEINLMSKFFGGILTISVIVQQMARLNLCNTINKAYICISNKTIKVIIDKVFLATNNA